MPSDSNRESDFFDTHLKSYVEFERHSADVLARVLTKSLGSIWFLNTAICFMLVWVVVNVGWIPGVLPFDPYPFTLLMMLVSLFAVFLAIVLLISQNRQGRTTEVRQRMDFEINVRAEHEITKMLTMLHELHVELGIFKTDRELEKMKEKTDISKIKGHVEKGIAKEDAGQTPHP